MIHDGPMKDPWKISIYDTYQCIRVLLMYISLNLHTHICAYVPMKIDTVYIYR